MNLLTIKRILGMSRNILLVITGVSFFYVILSSRTRITSKYDSYIAIGSSLSLLLAFIVQGLIVYIGKWTFPLETKLIRVPKSIPVDPQTLGDKSFQVDTRPGRHISGLILLASIIFTAFISIWPFLTFALIFGSFLFWMYLFRIEFITFQTDSITFECLAHKYLRIGRAFCSRYSDLKVIQNPISEGTTTVFYGDNKRIFGMFHGSWSSTFQEVLDEVRKRLYDNQYELYAEP